ncbi:MAG: hypothetical protein HWD57_08020 [Candidatus Accumulibacter cognatus]|uniref:Uncharacterized protein n=1 Tax=Candidatus Accumulibacter cognatus TaxID=2954383 RepID=A0A7D5NBL6_9PROT|nr:MAG: hypothetical protein HWD57_08020 [Candidatus Accumulibacter cognatus]
MPDVVFWPLFVTFAAVAIGATIKAVEATHGKKLADDECARLRAQLDILNNPENEKTLDVQIPGWSKTEESPEPQSKVVHNERLEELREKILVIVSQNDLLNDAQIAELAGVSKQVATLHLHELRSTKFVRSSFGLDENSYEVSVWFLEQPGRKYLSENELL